jgi:hypothetical protein
MNVLRPVGIDSRRHARHRDIGLGTAQHERAHAEREQDRARRSGRHPPAQPALTNAEAQVPGRGVPSRLLRRPGEDIVVGPGKFHQPASDRGITARLAEGGHPALERSQCVRFVPARLAASQVIEHAVAFNSVKLAIDLSG